MMMWGSRIAAGLTLLVGGTAIGRVSAGAPLLPTTAETPLVAELPKIAQPVSFRNTTDAMQVLSASQQQYQEAAAFLAAQDTTSHFIGLNQTSFQARLAALDQMAAATRAALYQAPQDPVLNQYYLSALGARAATLKQMGAVMPANRQLVSY
jgi:hypothetical protein